MIFFDEVLVKVVVVEVECLLLMLLCVVVVGVSWCDYGMVIVICDLDEVVVLLDCIVFEYFEFCVDDFDVLV